jgi:histone-lysine N-methyltransferase EZH2
VSWDDPVDLTTLRTILDISPDLSPCDLAVVCRKPCREVCSQAEFIYVFTWPQKSYMQIYLLRTTIYKDDVISDVQLQGRKKSRASRRGHKRKKMKDGGFKYLRDRVISDAPYPLA